jgi:hypothetical protein
MRVDTGATCDRPSVEELDVNKNGRVEWEEFQALPCNCSLHELK